jgi:hypothetical protein
MDNDSKCTIKLLETIGECSANLAMFSSELQVRPEVLSTKFELECRLYPSSGTSLSFYVDAELKSGNSISYFLGLSWDENEWIISARISLNDEQGYKVVKDFPNRRTEHYPELLTILLSAASELMNSFTINSLSS